MENYKDDSYQNFIRCSMVNLEETQNFDPSMNPQKNWTSVNTFSFGLSGSDSKDYCYKTLFEELLQETNLSSLILVLPDTLSP